MPDTEFIIQEISLEILTILFIVYPTFDIILILFVPYSVPEKTITFR